MLDLASRRKACEDTLTRTPDIVSATIPHHTLLDSAFISAQLPPLTKSSPSYPGFTCGSIKVYDSDAFALARAIPLPAASSTSPNRPTGSIHGKIGILNLASDREPGGGWRFTLSKTQEEALCYSSTLYATLRPEWYPFPNTGPGSCAGIISPNVVVFKDTIDNDLIDLPVQQRHVVTVITVAAPLFPKLTENGEDFADASQLHDLQEKILLVLRLAATNGVTTLILGAMGCGAYGCPPRAVAREMRAALQRDEFSGWFEDIKFAVYAAGHTGKRNLDVFTEVFKDVA